MEHQSRNKPYANLWGKRKRETNFSVETYKHFSAEQQISLFIPTSVSPLKNVEIDGAQKQIKTTHYRRAKVITKISFKRLQASHSNQRLFPP